MDWNNHFGTVFFNTWEKAGLPFHEDFSKEYIETREGVDFKNDWIKKPHVHSPALEDNLLRSVYGFGALLGKVFNEMLGLNDSTAKSSSDWCGRFNLGISLFDYLCDESKGGVDRVNSLKVFQPFIKTEYSNSSNLSPTEDYLNKLVESVLLDLEIIAIKNKGILKTDSLFKVMKQLFEAQNFLSKVGLTDRVNLSKIKKALYLKSAEPFRVMAEYNVRITDTNDMLLLNNARSIGTAVGNCYCLIDDAKDVWIDLKARQWNLFLHLAALEDSSIFSKKSNDNINNKLLNIWKQENHAEKISNQIVKGLVHATQKLNLPEKTKQHTLGLIAASLWHWHKY